MNSLFTLFVACNERSMIDFKEHSLDFAYDSFFFDKYSVYENKETYIYHKLNRQKEACLVCVANSKFIFVYIFNFVTISTNSCIFIKKI